jgi:hypothetical protein
MLRINRFGAAAQTDLLLFVLQTRQQIDNPPRILRECHGLAVDASL